MAHRIPLTKLRGYLRKLRTFERQMIVKTPSLGDLGEEDFDPQAETLIHLQRAMTSLEAWIAYRARTRRDPRDPLP